MDPWADPAGLFLTSYNLAMIVSNGTSVDRGSIPYHSKRSGDLQWGRAIATRLFWFLIGAAGQPVSETVKQEAEHDGPSVV